MASESEKAWNAVDVLLDAADQVEETWDHGNLADAVRKLLADRDAVRSYGKKKG